MLDAIVRFALTQRLFVMLASAALLGVGILAVRDMPIDAFPDVSTTQVKIIVRAPGMTPAEVETRITAPIEIEMLGIEGQRVLRSTTKYAIADITIDFEESTDIYWARQQVSERLGSVWGDLPPGIAGGVAPITTPLGEMFMFTVEGDELGLAGRRALLDWVIRPALRTVPGVADVNALGGTVETFEVVPSASAMLAHAIDTDALLRAIAENNRNDGAGRVVSGEEVLLVRTEGRVADLDDVRSIIVRPDPLEPVRLGDIATVRLGALERYGAVTSDGEEETVQGLVLGLRGANAREVVRGVRTRLAELEPALPEGVRIEVFYDRGDLVRTAVRGISIALGSAMVLVILVLVGFLSGARAALTASVVLPLAVLAAFVAMRFFDMSANLMSLGGLAIAIGMLVDSAVVVVENVDARLSSPGSERLPRLHVIYRAVREVALPIASGSAIIMLVFLPLLSLEGLEGKLFGPVALAIVFALGSALVLSLTCLPVLASFFLQRRAEEKVGWMARLERRYRSALELAFAHPRAVMTGTGILLVVGMVGFGQLGRTFLPTMNEGTIVLQLEKLPSISLEKSLDLDLRVERALIERVPEIVGVVARTGSDEIGLDPMGLNQTDAYMVMAADEEGNAADVETTLERMREVMKDFPGVAYGLTQPIDMRVSEMLTGVRGDVAVKIFSDDLDALDAAAARVQSEISSIAGAQDVFRTRLSGAEFLRLELDRMEIGRLGLSVEPLQRMLRSQVEGFRASTVYRGSRRIPLVVRGEADVRSSPFTLSEVQVPGQSGTSVGLERLGSFARVDGPVQIQRESASRYAVVTANVRGRDLVGFVDEARSTISAKGLLAPGMRIEWSGQFENQQRANRRLLVVVPIALAFIFLLLFATFRSLRQASLILAMVPLALIGGVFGLWATGEFLSVPATIGFIALLGIAVLNGVVLVSTFNQLRAEGTPPREAVHEGAVRRLRPVLMTATSTALGLVPLLAADGPGAELQRPLAIVVTSGLATATGLTLFVLPMLYERFAIPRPKETIEHA